MPRRFRDALGGPPNDTSLFDLAPRGVYLAANVATRAGGLLPHHFTHYPDGSGLVCFLLHLSSHGLENPAPGCYPARCPLVFGLSSAAYTTAAIARSASLNGSDQYSKKRLTFEQRVTKTVTRHCYAGTASSERSSSSRPMLRPHARCGKMRSRQ